MRTTPTPGLPEGIKTRWPLFCLLVGAFGVRLAGINYGLPLDVVPDEESLIYGALQMLNFKTLFPISHPGGFTLLYYPTLIPYIYLVFFTPVLLAQYLMGNFPDLLAFKQYFAEHMEGIWLTARFVQVLFGTATVYLVYKIGSILAGERVGLLAGAFLAVSFNHVLLSHFAKQWVIVIFLMTLVLYLALLWPVGRRGDAVIGSLCGLSFGASLLGFFSWLYYLGVFIFKNRSEGSRMLLNKQLRLSLAIGAAVSLFFVIAHWHYFLWLFKKAGGAYITAGEPKSLGEYLSSFGYMISVFAHQEPLLFALAVAGMLTLAFRQQYVALGGVCMVVVSYISYLYWFVHFESRYISFLLPLTALMAGYGLEQVVAYCRSYGKWMAWSAVVLVLCVNVVVVARLDYLLMQPDTRLEAKRWLEEHEKDALVVLSSGTSGVHLVSNRIALTLQKQYGGLSLREELRLEKLQSEQDSSGVFSVNVRGWREDKQKRGVLKAFIEKYGHEVKHVYYVVNYWTSNTLSDLDRAMIQNGMLIKKFDNGVGYVHLIHDFPDPVTILFRMRSLGTTVEIYELSTVLI